MVNFNSGYEIKNVVSEDLYLVQFHSNAKVGSGRSLKYWTTFEEANGISTIDDIALKHSSVGDFTYNPKTGQISRMKGGGHGQSNINFLEENGIEYNIVKEYDNGVRVGNVPKHKTPSKRTGTGQAWFPKNWSDSKIKEAGNYVTNLPDNKNLPDGVIGYGEYDGVRVVIIKTDGKIGTIFPDADLQP